MNVFFTIWSWFRWVRYIHLIVLAIAILVLCVTIVPLGIVVTGVICMGVICCWDDFTKKLDFNLYGNEEARGEAWGLIGAAGLMTFVYAAALILMYMGWDQFIEDWGSAAKVFAVLSVTALLPFIGLTCTGIDTLYKLYKLDQVDDK